MVHTVSKILKNLCIFRPQQITLLITIPITIVTYYVLEKFINVDVIAIRTVAAAVAIDGEGCCPLPFTDEGVEEFLSDALVTLGSISP